MIFNTYFANVAEAIGNDYTFNPDHHPSINNIKENNPNISEFDFCEVNESDVSKTINMLNVKKATGVDKISAKLLKLSKPALTEPLTN